MHVRLAPHAEDRATERGATKDEIVETVRHGDAAPAKHGRTVYHRTFRGLFHHHGKTFDINDIRAYAAPDGAK